MSTWCKKKEIEGRKKRTYRHLAFQFKFVFIIFRGAWISLLSFTCFCLERTSFCRFFFLVEHMLPSAISAAFALSFKRPERDGLNDSLTRRWLPKERELFILHFGMCLR